jgi:ATP-dependent 26S proteasome regulatory subunit
MAIGALVVLIILCAIYYYYYKKDKSCIETNIKLRFPGADASLVDAYTTWESGNVITMKKSESCPVEYNQISGSPDDICTICEVKELPQLPAELEAKVKAWAATPQGAATLKALPKSGVIASPSPSS